MAERSRRGNAGRRSPNCTGRAGERREEPLEFAPPEEVGHVRQDPPQDEDTATIARARTQMERPIATSGTWTSSMASGPWLLRLLYQRWNGDAVERAGRSATG